MLPLIIGGVAALGGGILNYFAQMSAQDRLKALQDKQLQEFIGIHVPDPAQQKLALQQFVEQGKLSPVLEKAFKQDPSAFQNVVADAGQKGAQNRALSSLEDLGKGGLSLSDKADLEEAMYKTHAQDQGNRAAIQQSMAQRGLGGSGFDLQAKLANQQQTTDQNARNSLSVAGMAQKRALDAIQGAGGLATSMRTQDVGEQERRAAAQDAINRFNTSNSQDVMTRNTALQNMMNEKNLAAKQGIANMNTTAANDAARYNAGLGQKQFENQLGLANAKAGVYGDQGKQAVTAGQLTGSTLGNIGGSIGAIGSTVYQNNRADDQANKTSADNNNFWQNYFKGNRQQQQQQEQPASNEESDKWSKYMRGY